MACIYDRQTPKAPSVRILSNDDDSTSAIDISSSDLLSEGSSWSVGLDGGTPDLGYDEAASKDIGMNDLVLMHSLLNADSFIHDGSSEDLTLGSLGSSDVATADSTPFSDSTALSSFTPDPTSDGFSLGFSPNSFQLPFEESMLLNTYSLNTDFSFSPAFTLNTNSFDSSGTFFDSPYLKLRFLTSFHHSASRCSTVTRRQTPFIQTSLNAGCQLGQGLLLQNIRCYPRMMLETNGPPPFIHRCALAQLASKENLQSIDHGSVESLAACQSIVQMHSMKNDQTSAFLWRTIASEQKRLIELVGTVFLCFITTLFSVNRHTNDLKHREVDEWNTLAMLQASTIYILLRIFSDDSFSIDFDNDLIQTMTSIAIKSEESGFLCTSEVSGEIPTWSEWILMESKRRTITLLFIIHLLFDINPGQHAKALSGLSQLPLPAYKLIWQATTKSEWMKHYNDWLRGREGRFTLSYGDMLYLGKIGKTGGEDPRLKDLNAWYTNVDAFGILVMMAATSLSI